jgi:alkylation response protein AidB-like acyl-CoA dehydrogenase
VKALVAVGAIGTFIPVAVASVAGGVVGGSPSGSPPLSARVAFAYRQGARWCPGLAWEVLAAVGFEESKHGSDDGALVDERSGRKDPRLGPCAEQQSESLLRAYASLARAS